VGLVYLFIAIIGEVVATSALKAAAGFTKLVPSILVVVGYGVAFYFLSLTLKTIPIGIAYAVWSGVGTVLTAMVGYWYFKEPATTLKVLSAGLIVLGVIGMHLGSRHA